MQLTPNQAAEARRLINQENMPWDTVAARYGLSGYQLRTKLDPAYAEYRREQVRRARALKQGDAGRKAKLLPPAGVHRKRVYNIVQRESVEGIVPVPTHVAAEAEQAHSAPRSRTAELMGDPLPGRSALDRRR